MPDSCTGKFDPYCDKKLEKAREVKYGRMTHAEHFTAADAGGGQDRAQVGR